MKKLIVIVFLAFLNIGFSQNNALQREIDSLKLGGRKLVTLTLNYGNIACPCAQWAESKFNGRRSDQRVQMYLEPANDSLGKIINVDDFPLKIKVFGLYTTKSGFPENYKPNKGNPEPAPVFRFYRAKVISKG